MPNRQETALSRSSADVARLHGTTETSSLGTSSSFLCTGADNDSIKSSRPVEAVL